jgi:predicted GIY-YIG superfamily endonuclease
VTVLASAADAAPHLPGVYVFMADDGEVLYVGKATDIAKRLRQHSREVTTSARVARLYTHVAEVRWEEHRDEPAASAREADLIVALRPRFNASIRGDGRWAFVNVTYLSDNRLRFEQDRTLGGTRSYGCFPHLGPGVASRPGIACTEGYVALLRLVWAASGAPGRYPAAIAGASAAAVVELGVGPSIRPGLHSFLSGSSEGVLEGLRADAAAREPFLQPGIRTDHAAAVAFFNAGPAALRGLRLRCRRRAGPMSKQDISGMLVADLRASIGDFRIPVVDSNDEGLGRRARPWAR